MSVCFRCCRVRPDSDFLVYKKRIALLRARGLVVCLLHWTVCVSLCAPRPVNQFSTDWNNSPVYLQDALSLSLSDCRSVDQNDTKKCCRSNPDCMSLYVCFHEYTFVYAFKGVSLNCMHAYSLPIKSVPTYLQDVCMDVCGIGMQAQGACAHANIVFLYLDWAPRDKEMGRKKALEAKTDPETELTYVSVSWCVLFGTFSPDH